MRLSDIQASLARIGMKPTRSLGQNFLHDQNLAEWIVAQLELAPDEPWVELGPGLGALTEFALQRSRNALLVEKDARMVAVLRERFPGVEIVHGDAGEFDVRELFARGPVKVLGNLPYYVSSQILFWFTNEPSPASAFIFTLQKELAERLAARPRTKSYGALTLLIGRRWEVKYLRRLPAKVFHPAPNVESAVVALTPRGPGDLPECDGALFARLVKQGFAQRRKLLRKNLADRALDWPALTARLGVEVTTRAEELSLVQWVTLTNFAAGAVAEPESAQDVHGEIFDVVDEADRVVAQASRHEVHERDLRHRAVHVFVFNSRGELFLQKRSRWKDRHPQQWDSSAAGHVSVGETYELTAPREIREELGVDAPAIELATIAASERTGWEFVRLYRAQHDGPFTLHPAEIESGAYFTLDQIARWSAARPQDFAPGFLECWRAFRESN
jgi:16S rRNA (adenine1518-N6/adenine1519-N6)-dimethyltransferase